jgi:hypothetical protein
MEDEAELDEPNVGLLAGEVSAHEDDDEELPRYAVDSVPVLPYRPERDAICLADDKWDAWPFSHSFSLASSKEERDADRSQPVPRGLACSII